MVRNGKGGAGERMTGDGAEGNACEDGEMVSGTEEGKCEADTKGVWIQAASGPIDGGPDGLCNARGESK